jgi:hypothetical protein
MAHVVKLVADGQESCGFVVNTRKDAFAYIDSLSPMAHSFFNEARVYLVENPELSPVSYKVGETEKFIFSIDTKGCDYSSIPLRRAS